jgi:hypothetical protein
MEKSITTNSIAGIEKALIEGDLSKLTPEQRVQYYLRVCDSMGLNPFTRPFDYIVLNGRLTLYAKRDATDQLRKIHNVSVQITGREVVGDLYVVTARATMPDGRYDESIGAVAIAGLRGDALANAIMKAETKAKRRATLSICGMGFLDETEVETIPEAKAPPNDVRKDERPYTPEALKMALVKASKKAKPEKDDEVMVTQALEYALNDPELVETFLEWVGDRSPAMYAAMRLWLKPLASEDAAAVIPQDEYAIEEARAVLTEVLGE